MLINNALSVAEIRAQELRQLPKMLVSGLGISLLIHLLVAIAFNYLPTPIPENAVEVTIIDASELPSEPRPTVPLPSPSVIKTTPVATPIPTKPKIKPFTPLNKTTVVNPAGRSSPVKIPIKIAKKSIEQPPQIQRSTPRQQSSKNIIKPSIWQPPTNDNMAVAPLIPSTPPTIKSKPRAQPTSPQPQQAVIQKPSQRSINPIPPQQFSFNDLDNQPVPRSATPQPSITPSSQVISSQNQIDNLDQFDQDPVGILSTPSEDPPVWVNDRPVAPKFSTGSKITPSIATNPSSHNSSRMKSRSGTALGSTKNTVDVQPSKDQGFRVPTQTSGKISSGSSIGQNNNSGRGEPSAIADGQKTGQAAINGGNGDAAKNDNSSAPAGITLRCAPNSDCKPPYPEEADGAKGVTVLEILLADDGSVNNAKISKSSGNNLFDRAAVDAAPMMRFVVPSGRQRKFRVAIKFTPETDY
jgi:TonB family protein